MEKNARKDQEDRSAITFLFALLAAHRWNVVILCALAITSVTLSFSPHVFVWWLADQVLVLGSVPERRALLIACALLVLGLFGRYGFAAVTSIGSHLLAFSVQRDLRSRLADHLAAVPMGYLASQPRGRLTRLAVDDVEALEDSIAHLIPELAACTVAPLALLGVMLALDPRMALIAIAPALLSFAVLAYLMRAGEVATQRYQSSLSDMSAIADETVRAFPLVKTHGAHMIVLDRAEAAFQRFRKETGDWISKAAVPAVWFQVLTSSAPVAVLPAGVYLHLHNSLSLSALLLFLILAISLGDMFSTLGSLSHRLSAQKQTLERIIEFLDTAPQKRSSTPSKPKGFDVSFDGVSFAYADRVVLQDIQLHIKEGESVALVGPSGSGKSTLLRLLCRFWDVVEGRIQIGGVDLRHMEPAVLNRSVSCVFQDVYLFSQSIRDNIRLGRPDATEDAVVTAARLAQIHGFIETLPEGYDTLLSEGGRNLSGGQRQRISIARAILHDSPILLLDEATAYADPQNERCVQQAISEVARAKTVFAIAHRLNTVASMDRIIVMDGGRILDQGDHDSLMQRCVLYRELWEDHAGLDQFRFSRAAEEPLAAPRRDAQGWTTRNVGGSGA